MRHARPTSVTLTFLALAVSSALQTTPAAAAASTATATTSAPTAARPNPAKYLGTWNYDLPDSSTLRNVAVISCPATNPQCPVLPDGSRPSLQIPQIGTIDFTRNADGTVTGRTDQGCTWNFEVEPRSLALNGAQTCFNHVIGSAYTITTWTVSVSGDREQETLIATSHQPTGDWDFVLQSGARTKANVDSPRDDTRRFTGSWTYDPANPQTMDNIVTTVAPDGSTTESPETGSVLFTRTGNHSIAAHTADGCTWTLQVQGNTAELQPADQICQLPGTTATGANGIGTTGTGSTETLTHWSIASDGHVQDSVLTGIDEQAGQPSTSASTFALSVGSSTKS